MHASVIYVISEVFFGSIRLERRARTRVTATPGLKPCNRFNVKQYSGQLYAIRLCARDKPPTLFLFANRLSRGVRARVSAPASGFSREQPRDRLVSYARYPSSSSNEFLRGARLSDWCSFRIRRIERFFHVGEEIGGWEIKENLYAG